MAPSASQVLRRPGVMVILLNAILMFGGFFMLIPFVSVYGTRDLGLSAAAVGSILAIRIFLQQGLTIFGGAIADKIGYKPVLAAGILIRAFGFTMFAYAVDYSGLLASAIVSSLGGVLFESTHKAALATLVKPRERAIAFSLISTSGRIGTLTGPLLAVVLLPVGFYLVSWVAAGCFYVSFLAVSLFLPATRGEDLAPTRPTNPPKSDTSLLGALKVIPQMFGMVWADKPFVLFTMLTTGFWFVNAQIFLTLPLYVSHLVSSDAAVGALLAINSGFALLTQFPVVAWANRRSAPMPIMIGGFVVMSIGLVSFALGVLMPGAWGVAGLVMVLTLPVVLYALGDLLVQPTLAAITGNLARPEALGSYFGFASISVAFGGGLGNALGGWLFDQAVALKTPHAPWLLYAIICFSLALIFRWYSRIARASLERAEAQV